LSESIGNILNKNKIYFGQINLFLAYEIAFAKRTSKAQNVC